MCRLDQPFGGDAIPYPFEDETSARAEVVRRARELVHRVLQWFPQWNPPPFDPRLYAEMIGIPVIESFVFQGGALESCDALLVPVAGVPNIVLNSRVRSRGRRNFSVAHEIAHSWFEDPYGVHFFHRLGRRERQSLDAEEQCLERLCDTGASELIMPHDWFRAALERRGLSGASVPALARDFDVSLEAAALRTTEVSEDPCVVVLVESCAPHGSARRPGARVRRLFAPDRLPLRLPAGSRVCPGSLLHRAATGQEPCEGCEEFPVAGKATRLRVSACGVSRGNGRHQAGGVGVAVLTMP